MELPVIAGRECVPVRLLPYLTDWRPLSPDVIARLLAEHDAWRTWSARTYNLQGNGSYIELPPRVWDVIEDDLTILARELEGQEAFEFQQLPEWRRRSVERLPAAVFVWRDELEADYARTFGRQPYPSLRPGARETSEEGRQVQIPLDAARRFFGLGKTVGSSINLDLNNVDTQESRTLVLTLNRNATARLSIRELEYGSRPCVLIFTKQGRRRFNFELVRRAIDPSRYDDLIAECKQTPPVRRWKL